MVQIIYVHGYAKGRRSVADRRKNNKNGLVNYKDIISLYWFLQYLFDRQVKGVKTILLDRHPWWHRRADTEEN